MPYSFFPNMQQQSFWGAICGDINLQTDLIDKIQEISSEVDDCIIQSLDMSKYGLIYSSEYLFPKIIKLCDSRKAYLVGIACSTSTGSLRLSAKLNGTAISEISSIFVRNEPYALTLTEPIELRNNDVLTSETASAENASDLHLCFYVRYER